MSSLRPLCQNDRRPVVDILNYFVENGFAAYAEEKFPDEVFDHLMQMIGDYPAVAARDETGAVIGFGFLRAHHPLPAFRRTAEVTYFIRQEHTRKGLGRMILEHLIQAAAKRGIDTVLANISSVNEQSINFHRKMGFEECGRFRRIGRKFGRDFDVIWMQRLLQ